ncbi:MAG TPA: MBG domain-containing protein, partial [Prolixibacteraceae bacterium]|nr:MBG domain-containing protein [Prolixibacteraceae bacterium]
VNESTDAGIYPGAISVNGGSDNNYKLKYLPGDFEVQKAPLTVRAHNQSRMYGHPNPELTILYEGFVNGQDPGVLDVLPVALTSALTNSPAGNYPIEVSGGLDNNYRFEYINGVLSIDSKTLPVVTWDIPAPIVYGTALDTMQQNAKANIAGTFSYSPAKGTVLNTGMAQQLSVIFTPADTATYQTVEQRVSIDVTPAQLTIRADSYRLASGSELPGLGCRVEGFVNGETIEELDVMPQVSTTATSTSQPGVYPITVSGAQAQNYEFVYVEGTLEIVEKQTPEIVWETPSAIVYGTALNSSQLNAVANVAGTYVYSPSEGSILEAGQAQELSLLFIPVDTVAYARVETTVILEVQPAVLSVSANDASVVYGQELPAFGYSISGFVNGETASDLLALPEAVAEQNNRPDAGTYPIVVRGGSSNNYVFEYSNGTLSVSKAPVMVTARDTKMKRGEALPEFSLDYEGLVYGQSSTDLEHQATVSTIATADSPVGEYELIPGGAADSNYQFEYVSGKLTIEAGTSFAELALRNAKVYPNPFIDELSIAFDQSIEAGYTISTLSGQKLIEGHIEGSGQKLNLSALRKGVYLLHVNSNDCVKTFRLVKH